MSEQNEKRIAYDCQIYLDASPDVGCSVLVRCRDEGALRAHLETDSGCQAVFTRVVREDSVRSFQAYSVGVYIIIAFALAMSLINDANRRLV